MRMPMSLPTNGNHLALHAFAVAERDLGNTMTFITDLS